MKSTQILFVFSFKMLFALKLFSSKNNKKIFTQSIDFDLFNVFVFFLCSFRLQVQHYILVVQAQDNGHPSLSTTITVYCNVWDLNDNAPIFDPMSYSNEIYENIAIGKDVVTVSATDIDSGTLAFCKHYVFFPLLYFSGISMSSVRAAKYCAKLEAKAWARSHVDGICEFAYFVDFNRPVDISRFCLCTIYYIYIVESCSWFSCRNCCLACSIFFSLSSVYFHFTMVRTVRQSAHR